MVRLEDKHTAETRRTPLLQAANLLEHYGIPTEELCTVHPRKLAAKTKQAQLRQLEETLSNRRIHGVYAQELQKPDTDMKASVKWLVDGTLSAQTEATLAEMQDGTTRTRKYLQEVTGQSTVPINCRACEERPESLGHILQHPLLLSI